MTNHNCTSFKIYFFHLFHQRKTCVENVVELKWNGLEMKLTSPLQILSADFVGCINYFCFDLSCLVGVAWRNKVERG